MKKLILFSIIILLVATSASAVLKLNTALNLITGGAGNFTNVTSITYYGDGSHLTGIDALQNNITTGISADSSCNCTNRLLSSEGSATYTVGAGESINDVICDHLPYILRHRITINVDGAYDGDEDVCIPPYIGEQSIDYSGGQLRLRGDAGENVVINSIFASGINGQANPYFYNLNITGVHPYYTGGCAVCIFGVQQAEMYELKINGAGITYGITSYGSNLKVRDTYIGGGVNYGLETKQGGRIYASNMTGTVDNYAYYTAGGDILIDLGAGSSLSTMTGSSGRFDQTVGPIWEQRGASYDKMHLWGLSNIPDLEAISEDASLLLVNASSATIFKSKVGIGINSTSPGKDLEVSGAQGGIRVTTQSADLWSAGLAIAKRGNSSDYYGQPINNSEAGYIYFDAYINSNYRHIARIGGLVNGNPSSTSYPGRLSFMVVKPGSTSATEKMSIDQYGVVLKDAACSGGCLAGTLGYNASHLCICTATNTWEKVAIS